MAHIHLRSFVEHNHFYGNREAAGTQNTVHAIAEDRLGEIKGGGGEQLSSFK